MSTWLLLRDAQARRTWLRQAAGVFRATRTAHARPQVAWTRLLRALVIQGGVLLVLALLCASGPPAVPRVAGLALPGGALVLLVFWQLAWLQVLETDALREVESGTLDVLTCAPLPSSAYVAGKLAFLHWLATSGFLSLLPVLLLGWALSLVTFSSLVATFLVLQVGSLAHGAWMLGEAVRSGARRGARRPATRWSGILAGLTVLALLFLLPTLVALQSAGAGTGAATPWIVLLSLLPATALFATTPWAVASALFGLTLPAWIAPLALLAAGAAISVGTARQRWKPLSSTSGADLRLGLLAWLVFSALVVVGAVRQGDAEHAAVVTGLLTAVLVLVPAWAGASELSDVASRGGSVLGGVLTMRRSTAGRFLLVALGVVAVTCALLAPAGVPRPWAMSLLALATAIPFALLATEAARWLPASRVAAWVLGVVIAALAAFLPLVAEIARAAAGARLPDASTLLLGVLSAASPVRAIFSAAGLFAGSQVDGSLVYLVVPGLGTFPLWAIGAVEHLLLLAALLLARPWRARLVRPAAATSRTR